MLKDDKYYGKKYSEMRASSTVPMGHASLGNAVTIHVCKYRF